MYVSVCSNVECMVFVNVENLLVGKKKFQINFELLAGYDGFLFKCAWCSECLSTLDIFNVDELMSWYFTLKI